MKNLKMQLTGSSFLVTDPLPKILVFYSVSVSKEMGTWFSLCTW